MPKPRTPLPWAQSDIAPRMLFRDTQGVIDVNNPVASFNHIEDAAATVSALDLLYRNLEAWDDEEESVKEEHEELITDLRNFLEGK